jgi:hypothetical protein
MFVLQVIAKQVRRHGRVADRALALVAKSLVLERNSFPAELAFVGSVRKA